MEDLTIQDLVWINLAMQEYKPQLGETYEATKQKMADALKERATNLSI